MTAAAQANANFANALSFPVQAPGGTGTCPVGRIRYGIFFDGTGNNMYRDWGKTPEERVPKDLTKEPKGILHDDDIGGPTNVAKLYELFIEDRPLQEKGYHIGPGGGYESSTNKPKGAWQTLQNWYENYSPYQWGGGGFGAGSSGREDWGIDVLTEFFNKANNQLAKEKRVDVFGFSRGAAIARDFINKVKSAGIDDHKQPDGYKYIPAGDTMVQVPAYKRTKPIFFEFLGVFDTVASMGAGTVGAWGNSAAGYNFAVQGRPADTTKTPDQVINGDNVQEKEEWVHRTFHCIAEDEFRDVFPVELLGLDPKARDYILLPKYLREKPYPGAHSDVGGGYGYTSAKAAIPDKVENRSYRGIPYKATIPGKPAEPEKKPYLANIPLKDMWDEATRAAVPLKGLNALPVELTKVPGELQGAYDSYVALRTKLINDIVVPAGLPRFADYLHSVEQDPIYIQTLPEKLYQEVQKARTADPNYQAIFTNYIHQPEKETKWRIFDGIKRFVRADTWGTVQRGVTYLSRQNSYDDNSKVTK